MKTVMTKLILILTILACLCAMGACGSRDEDEGIFMPASEEDYYVLDEGKTESSGNAGKTTDSNTNAKTSSGKKDSEKIESEDQTGTATATPAPTSSGSGTVTVDPSKDETPFVPAQDSSGSKSSKKKSSGSGVIQDDEVTVEIE